MNNAGNKWVWLLLIPVVLGVIYYFFPPENKLNWNEHYRNDSKDPYGTYVIHELLKDYNKNASFTTIEKPVNKTIVPNIEAGDNYVFIGDNLFLSPKDLDSLLNFVAIGNTAFISGNNFPSELMDTLFQNVCTEWNGHYNYSDTAVTFNFLHWDLKDSLGYTFTIPTQISYRVYDWHGINGRFFCDSLVDTDNLGNIIKDTMDFVNFIKVSYGSGNFLFHTNPIVFTNYYLLQPIGRAYSDKVLSHLGKGNIYWDKYSSVSRGNDSGGLGNSPLRLILGNQSLKIAWYLCLGCIFMYILFFAKRKQRAIPILEQPVNTSLEFVKTVGNLYFQQNQHRKLMRLKRRYFLSFIRHRYYLSSTNFDQANKKKLAQKSGIGYEQIENIFEMLGRINRYEIHMGEDDLIKLHNSLDYFYKNCK